VILANPAYLQSFKVSKFQGFKVSRFQGFKVPGPNPNQTCPFAEKRCEFEADPPNLET
jgi:hypothetical protein